MDMSNLVDIDSVVVDSSLAITERYEAYCKDISDPYHYECKGLKVNLVFTDSGARFSDSLVNVLNTLQ